jgi:hypothetical protein
VGADEAALTRIAATTQILDIHRVAQLQSRQKGFSIRGDLALEKRGGVGSFRDVSDRVDGAGLFQNWPATERDEKFFCEFHVDATEIAQTKKMSASEQITISANLTEL